MLSRIIGASLVRWLLTSTVSDDSKWRAPLVVGFIVIYYQMVLGPGPFLPSFSSLLGLTPAGIGVPGGKPYYNLTFHLVGYGGHEGDKCCYQCVCLIAKGRQLSPDNSKPHVVACAKISYDAKF